MVLAMLKLITSFMWLFRAYLRMLLNKQTNKYDIATAVEGECNRCIS
jgi:hypothetical protein